MTQQQLMKSSAVVEWLFKAVQGVICFFAIGIYNDVQEIKQKLPVHEVRIEFLEKQMDKLKLAQSIAVSGFKHEDFITLDSLKKQ